MNIVWILHNYPPTVLAGAELAAHRLNKWLLTQGHSVTVYISSNEHEYESYPSEYEGVQIKPIKPFDCYSFVFESQTILMSQLWASRLARSVFDRNPTTANYIEFIHYVDCTVLSPYPWTTRDFRMVYNSNDTKKRALEIAPWLATKESYVLPPFFEPPLALVLATLASSPASHRHSSTNYPWITLVNFSKDKGADIFNMLAATDTTGGTGNTCSRKYVGIKGSHGSQETPHETVTLLPPTENMEEIWQNTRILVVLSTYETWSMVATESMMRGIPVVCADNIPALRENCGDAAIYVDRANIKDCLDAFEYIESNYEALSSKSIHQARKHLPNFDTYRDLLEQPKIKN